VTFGRSNSFGKVVLLTLFILTVLVVVASYLLVLVMGYGFIFFTSEGLILSMRTVNFPVFLFLNLIGFYTPELLVGAVFALIWIVYVLCFVVAWKWRESFHRVVRESLSRPFHSLFSNFLFIMPLLSSMLLTAVWAIISSQESVGIPTGQPSWPAGTPLQEIFFNLAYVPVAEEVGFRLIPMGLFTMFSVLLAERRVVGGGFKLLVTALFYPDGAKRMAELRNVGEHGVWRGISVGEWAMVLATSVIFAYAHVISPIGWEVGKFTSVFVQGFFFALTYLAYGFEAPILLHWFFNYYLFFFDPDVVTNFFPSTDPIFSLIELLFLGLGALGWAAFAAAGLSKLFRWRTTEVVTERKVKPSALWWLVPFFFGALGGIIAYVGVKSDDEKMAKNLLIFGILWSIFLVIIVWYIFSLTIASIPTVRMTTLPS